MREVDEKTGKQDVDRRCTGGLICDAQTVERLKYFVARDGFDIEGLGGTMIELFHDKGLLKEPADIFALTKKPEKVSKVLAEHRAALSEERRAAEGKDPVKSKAKKEDREDKVVENLMAAIEHRRTIALDRLINALGIRHVGETTARLIARHYRTIDAFLDGMKAENAREELESLEGIGGIVAEAISDFFDEKHNVKALDRLLAWLDVTAMAAPAKVLAGVRQDGGLHRHSGKDDPPGSQGAGGKPGREGLRLGIRQDRYRGGGAGRGLQAEGGAEAQCSGDGRRCLAEADRQASRPVRLRPLRRDCADGASGHQTDSTPALSLMWPVGHETVECRNRASDRPRRLFQPGARFFVHQRPQGFRTRA